MAHKLLGDADIAGITCEELCFSGQKKIYSAPPRSPYNVVLAHSYHLLQAIARGQIRLSCF